MGHPTIVLLPLHFVCDPVYHIQPSCQLTGDDRLRVGLFDKYKDGQQSDDLLRSVVGQDVLEDELSEDELVGRIDLCGSAVTSEGHQTHFTSDATLE